MHMSQEKNRKMPSFIEFGYDDEKERDTYIRELEGALQRYIKTGVQNKQLDDVKKLEQIFQRQAQEKFNVDEVVQKMLCESKREVLERQKQISQEQKGEKKELNLINDEISSIMFSVIEDSLVKRLPRYFEDIAYLSHMNMIYELYEREKQLRREEEEYEKISQRYQKMADITKKLSQKRRMEIKFLQESVELSEEELENIVQENEKMFNIRTRKDKYQISLSPIGRKFNAYMENEKEKYSREALNRLVFKNCDIMIDAIEKSIEGEIELTLELEDLSPSANRSIRHKYHNVVQKYIEKNEDGYIFDGEFKFATQGKDINNEKDSYRIAEEWYIKSGGIIQ